MKVDKHSNEAVMQTFLRTLILKLFSKPRLLLFEFPECWHFKTFSLDLGSSSLGLAQDWRSVCVC